MTNAETRYNNHMLSALLRARADVIQEEAYQLERGDEYPFHDDEDAFNRLAAKLIKDTTIGSNL